MSTPQQGLIPFLIFPCLPVLGMFDRVRLCIFRKNARPTLGPVGHGLDIDAHRQIVIRPAAAPYCRDRINTLPHHRSATHLCRTAACVDGDGMPALVEGPSAFA